MPFAPGHRRSESGDGPREGLPKMGDLALGHKRESEPSLRNWPMTQELNKKNMHNKRHAQTARGGHNKMYEKPREVGIQAPWLE